jgi:hypothetical protein
MNLDTSENLWPKPWEGFKPPHKKKLPKKGVKITPGPNRRDDERVLTWMKDREEGKSMSKIAEEWGVTKNSVIGALYRIAQEDIPDDDLNQYQL